MDSDQLVAMYRALLPILEIDFDTEVNMFSFSYALKCKKGPNNVL